MDPFSVIVGVIGAAAATVHTARRLREFLNGIKDAPEVVKSISRELAILQCSLATLDDLLQESDGFLEAGRGDHDTKCFGSLETILLHCQEKFKLIRRAVAPYIREHAGTKRYTWRMMADWINRKNDLDVLKQDLISAKVTLDLIVSIATLTSTRTGISHLQTQFIQLNTRLEEASEDSVSDVGSTSVVTDLGFALRRFLKEENPSADSSNPFLAPSDYTSPSMSTMTGEGKLYVSTSSSDGDNNENILNDDEFSGYAQSNAIVRPAGLRLVTKDKPPEILTPPDSPLARRFTFTSCESDPVSRSLTTNSITPFNQSIKPCDTKPKLDRRGMSASNSLTSPTHHDPLSKALSLDVAPSSLLCNGAGWDNFQIPLKTFADYFGISYKKMMKKGATSILNFGTVTATPISNSSAYVEPSAEGTKDNTWNHIYDSTLYRHSTPNWCLKIPGHKVAGNPPKRGISKTSLSKVRVRTENSSYEFIRLFLVAQRPTDTTAYNFQWTPFGVCTYVSHPRRIGELGTREVTTNPASTQIIADTTPISVCLAIKDETLTLRLKSSDDRTFLDPGCASWSVNPAISDT